MQTFSKFIYISLLSVTSLALACTSDDGVGDTATATESSSSSEGSTSSTSSTSEGTTEATTGTGTMGSSSSSSSTSSATETTGDPTTTTTGDTTTTTTGDTTTTTTGDTTTTGGGLCDPAPEDDACQACSKDGCCMEIEACDGNEGCECWLECAGNGGDLQECFLMCGQNPEFQALAGCLMGSCGDECGF
ncbi:MAG TPA: hypothetical protein ENK31_10595 [Nannocystis exedens]|nr:hypothetical protein [Nannocystis exedens]